MCKIAVLHQDGVIDKAHGILAHDGELTAQGVEYDGSVPFTRDSVRRMSSS